MLTTQYRSNALNPFQHFQSLHQQGLPEGSSANVTGCSQQVGSIISALEKNMTQVFILPMLGSAMINAGIFPGDLLIISSEVTPSPGQIIVALFAGKYTVGRYFRSENIDYLVPENTDLAAMEINDDDFQLIGVVSFVVRST